MIYMKRAWAYTCKKQNRLSSRCSGVNPTLPNSLRNTAKILIGREGKKLPKNPSFLKETSKEKHLCIVRIIFKKKKILMID